MKFEDCPVTREAGLVQEATGDEPAVGAPGGGAAGDERRCSEPRAEGPDEGRPGDAGDSRRPRASALPVRVRRDLALRHGHHQRLPFRHRIPVMTRHRLSCGDLPIGFEKEKNSEWRG